MNTVVFSLLIGIAAGIGAGLAHHFGYKLGYKAGHADGERDAVTWRMTDVEPPKDHGCYAVCWLYEDKQYWDKMLFFEGKWQSPVIAAVPTPDYWMPIPKAPWKKT